MTKGQYIADIIQKMISLQISINNPETSHSFDPIKLLAALGHRLANEIDDIPHNPEEEND